jgi:hypothetical protein
MKIDVKTILMGGAASLLAMVVWEVAGRDFVAKVRDGSNSGEAAETEA